MLYSVKYVLLWQHIRRNHEGGADMSYNNDTGHLMTGGYELYVRGIPQPERRQIMQELEVQAASASDRIEHLRITLLQSALQEVWSDGT